MNRSWVRLLAAVAENIGVPVGAYLLLTAVGWAPVWALVGAAGASVLVLAGQYLRRRELTALGVLVLVRFALGITVAVVTGDPRLEFFMLAFDSTWGCSCNRRRRAWSIAPSTLW